MVPVTGYVAREHVVTVPLDHSDPDGRSLDVFARELVAADRAGDDLPVLLHLQGGPGGAGPRPVTTAGWIDVALRTHRVLLLDQRGTGRSTPVSAATVAGLDGREIAAYLRHFRADSIVADAELLRARLLGDERWDTLGQSYGGFLTLTYLSRAPHGLRRCHVTGGIPSPHASAEDVYRRTFPRMARRTREFYSRYPADEAALRRVAEHLVAHDVRLPDGDRLTVARLRSLGLMLGMNHGMERLHWMLDEAWHGAELSAGFRYAVMLETGFVDSPIFALQEFIYGQPGRPTRWAAQQQLGSSSDWAPDADPLLLTGEAMFPWMFADIAALRPFAEAAEELAAYDDWQALYDLDQLAANEVPLAAAVYLDDVYVDSTLQIETLDTIPNARAWVTNEWEHDGYQDPRVLERLLAMTAGRA